MERGVREIGGREQREPLRQRTAVHTPPEREELPDNVMGKDQLSPSQQKGGGFLSFFLFPQETGVREHKANLSWTGCGWGEFGKGRFLWASKGCHRSKAIMCESHL